MNFLENRCDPGLIGFLGNPWVMLNAKFINNSYAKTKLLKLWSQKKGLLQEARDQRPKLYKEPPELSKIVLVLDLKLDIQRANLLRGWLLPDTYVRGG